MSIGAEGMTMNGSLPEFSIRQRFISSPHFVATLTPTGTLPVKATICVPECSTRNLPAGASPVTTWNRPSGNAEKASANRSVVSEVY